MRLICPNCSAEYEVDSAAIPDTGRDVQCSNCGHAWFQLPEGAAAEGADAPPAGTPAAPEPPAMTETAAPTEIPAAEAVAEDAMDTAAPDLGAPAADAAETTAEDTAAEPAAAAPELAPSALDETVLSVLREEAERESNARKAEIPQPVEVQPELALAAGATAAPASRTAAPRPSSVPDFSDLNDGAVAADTSRPARRDLFPDIDEINSTLSPGADGDIDPTAFPPPPRPRNGFRNGFILMLLLAGVLTAAYALAPRIAEQVPGAKAPLDSYVAAVDNGRLWLDGLMRNAITALRQFAESEG